MRELLFPVQHHGSVSLQTQLRRHLVDAILDGRLTATEPLPSCRRLAQALGISRNTVVLVYQGLADEGLLLSRERVGYFVNTDLVSEQTGREGEVLELPEAKAPVDWWHRLKLRPSRQSLLSKPKDWRRYPYRFIYGQCDPRLFPITAWRMCSRQALAIDSIRQWSEDSLDEDDPILIEEIRARVLPRRGIKATAHEILITLGAQNALYLLARLLLDKDTVIALEDPGYVDARNIFETTGARLRPLRVDGDGIIVDDQLNGCDTLYVTPSHQSPTTVTLSMERRMALIEKAAEQDFIIIEDDYEAETNFVSSPTAALKSIDRDHRVFYVGSFSKYLTPGLRMGYLVGDADFIREARLLRHLMLRHTPGNNQRTLALFISGGYYDALVQRLQRGYRDRWQTMGESLSKHMPETSHAVSRGGTSFWVQGPETLDSDVLAREALSHGIVLEPGSTFFASKKPPRNYFRLGFSAIEVDKIDKGIKLLSELIKEQI